MIGAGSQYILLRLYWPKTEAPSILPPGEKALGSHRGIQAHPEKQPVDPGRVIRNQQHRAGRFQRVQIVSPEAEQPLKQKTEEGFHGLILY